MSTIVYLNGQLLSLDEARISVTDYGFLFGYAVFETMHAYDGTVFRLKNHVGRLMTSLRMLDIHLESWEPEQAVTDTLIANRLDNARVRLTVSAGTGSPVTDLSTCEKPTVLVVALPFIPVPSVVYEKGFRLSIAEIRRNSHSIVQTIKKTDYLDSILARRAAREAGADDALLLNDIGYLAEGSTNNVFIMKDGTLKTPSRESGILRGITRDVVLELASQLNIQALETDVLPDELLVADEVFLTSSMMEIMPVTRIGDKDIRDGKPGPVTRRLMVAYKELVRQEINAT